MPMNLKQKNTALLVALVIVIAGAGIAAAAYYADENAKPVAAANAKHKPAKETIVWKDTTPAAQPAPAQPACNDENIVGMVTGGAIGGIAGHQVGKGSGNTAATIGGAVGGAYLGKKYIPTQNVTCANR